MLEDIVHYLIKNNLSISTMESCTGGGVANAITNIEGASEVLKYSAVTYSNEFKIKMGVSKYTIDKYSVYSIEVAREMSKSISDFTTSNYGIGITGKLNRIDKNNLFGKDNIAFVSIYDRDKDKYYTISVEAVKNTRKENKDLIIDDISKQLLKIIK